MTWQAFRFYPSRVKENGAPGRLDRIFLTRALRVLPPGHLLRLWRSFHHRTQGEVAALLGVSQVMLSRYEKGKATPSPETARLIEEVTGGELEASLFLVS